MKKKLTGMALLLAVALLIGMGSYTYASGDKPAAPQNVTAEGFVTAHNETSVRIRFDQPDDANISNYQVERKRVGGTRWVTLNDNLRPQHSGRYAYTDTTRPAADTPFRYRVASVNSSNGQDDKVLSDYVIVKMVIKNFNEADIGDVTAEVNDSGAVELNWSVDSVPFTQNDNQYPVFRIYRSSGDASPDFERLVENTGDSATSYTDTTVTADMDDDLVYNYKVELMWHKRAGLTTSGVNAAKSTASVTVPSIRPQAPIIVDGGYSYSTSVRPAIAKTYFSWSEPENTARISHYEIYRTQDDGDGDIIATADVGVTTYNDYIAPIGVKFFYTVVSVDNDGVKSLHSERCCRNGLSRAVINIAPVTDVYVITKTGTSGKPTVEIVWKWLDNPPNGAAIPEGFDVTREIGDITDYGYEDCDYASNECQESDGSYKVTMKPWDIEFGETQQIIVGVWYGYPNADGERDHVFKQAARIPVMIPSQDAW